MSDQIDEKIADYSDYPKSNNAKNRPLIGFGLPYVEVSGGGGGAIHVYKEKIVSTEAIRIDSLKISVTEASAMNISGIAKVYPLIDGVWCGYGPYSQGDRDKIRDFTIEFDPNKFQTAQEVYDAWKKSEEGEA
jgi:hypothetical protein